MDAIKEYHFLEELRFLGDAALMHADRIRQLAREWMSAKAEIKTLARYPRNLPFAESQRRQRRSVELSAQTIRIQGETMALTDAFLGLYGRMSLILFPTRDNLKPRGEVMRKALDIDENHPIRDRLLRNKWMHYDEVLEELSKTAGSDQIQPQRFSTSEDLAARPEERSVRLVFMDTLKFRYLGIGEFDLPKMFDAVEDVFQRTLLAIESWADRWPALVEDEGGE